MSRSRALPTPIASFLSDGSVVCSRCGLPVAGPGLPPGELAYKDRRPDVIVAALLGHRCNS